MASPNTLLRQAVMHVQARQYGQADQLYGQILQADPRNCEARFQRARLRAMSGDLAGSVALLEEIQVIDPGHLEACKALALLHEKQGDLARAEVFHRRATALAQSDAAVHYNLGVLLQNTRRDAEAAASYRRAIELQPTFTQALNNLGNILLGAEDFMAAADCYRRALAIDDRLLEARYNLGMALEGMKQPDEALRCFEKVLALQPTYAPAIFSIGANLNNSGNYDQAIACYRRAIDLDPDYYQAYVNLGRIHAARENLEGLVAAEGCFRKAVALRGDFSEAHFLLGRVFEDTGQLNAWIALFQAASQVDPEHEFLYAMYGFKVAMYLGDFKHTDAWLARILAHEFTRRDLGAMGAVLFTLQNRDVSQAELLKLYRKYNQLARLETGGIRLAEGRGARRDGKIRLGYLSPDFNYHVMGWIMADVLASHDRERFELYLYALGGKADEVTERFLAVADKFVRLDGLDAKVAAERIAADELDILVDLAGHTSKGQPLILAYQPAPLQITHLGYHGALGLDTVDFKLTDGHADLPENGDFLIEKLLPMAGCVMPLRHIEASATTLSRIELDMPDDAVVFGVFVGIPKLGERCLVAWKQVLDRVPNGLLAFSPLLSFERESYLRLTAAVGIPAARVRFIPAQRGLAEARARYRLIDLVLDSFPYSGGDTTMAALDMAVPVVTLRGTRQSERMTYSILKHLGLDECIAHTLDDYVELASHLAVDGARRREIAARIPALVEASGLSDMKRYTANLEDAYQRALAMPR